MLQENLMEKWAPVLNEETAGAIMDPHRKAVTAALLENTEKSFNRRASTTRSCSN